MGTSSVSGLSESEFGIVPRVIDDMFSRIKQASDSKQATYMVYCQFLEIYQEDIIDLLVPAGERSSTVDLPYIQEKKLKSGIVEIDVVNCRRIEVRSYEEMMDLLERGTRERSVGATNMNAGSSRSHAIFTVYLKFKENKPVNEATQNNNNNDDTDANTDTEVIDESTQQSMYAMDAEHGMITSKFNFVDLAGSERLKKTGAQGERMQEGININKGLLALGNVISALEKQAHNKHVPFRDSKITRLLQDSLGGNAKTLMIACVSPANTNIEETISTLQYANRARNIQNKPIKNVDPLSQQINIYKNRIFELEQLVALGGGSGSTVPAGWKLVPDDDYNKLIHDSAYHETEYELSIQRVKELRSQLSSKQDEYVELSNQYDSQHIYCDKLLQLCHANNIDLTTINNEYNNNNAGDTTLLQQKNTLLLKQQQKIIQLKNQVKTSIQIIENLKKHSVLDTSTTLDSPATEKKRKRTKGEIGLSIDINDENDTCNDDTDDVNNTMNQLDVDIDVNTISVSDCDDDEYDELMTMQSKLALSEREAQEQSKRQAELQIALGVELSTQQQKLSEQQLQYNEYQQLLSLNEQYELDAQNARHERDTVDNEIKLLQVNDREYEKKQKLLRDKLDSANHKIKQLEDKLKEYNTNKKRFMELEPLMKSKQVEIQRLLCDIEQKKRQRAEQQKKSEQNERKNRDILSSLKTQIAQLSRLQTTTQYQLKQEQRKRLQIDSILQRKQVENQRLKQVNQVIRPGTAAARNRLHHKSSKSKQRTSSNNSRNKHTRPHTSHINTNINADQHVLTELELQQLYNIVQNELQLINKRKSIINKITELYTTYCTCKHAQITHEAQMLDFYNTATNIDTDIVAREKYDNLEQDLITLTSHFKISESNLTDAIQQFNTVNKPKLLPEFRMIDIYETKKIDIDIYCQPQLRINNIHEANYIIKWCAQLDKLPAPAINKIDSAQINSNNDNIEHTSEDKEIDHNESANNIHLLSPQPSSQSHYKIINNNPALPHARSTTDIFNRLNDPSNATGVHRVKYEEKQRMKRATPQSTTTNDDTNTTLTNSAPSGTANDNTVHINGLVKSVSDSSNLSDQQASQTKYDTTRPVFDRLRDPSHFPTQAKIKDETAKEIKKQMQRQPSTNVIVPQQQINTTSTNTLQSITQQTAQNVTSYNNPTKHKSSGSYSSNTRNGDIITTPNNNNTQVNVSGSGSRSRQNSPRKAIQSNTDNQSHLLLSPQPNITLNDKQFISPINDQRILHTIDNIQATPTTTNNSTTAHLTPNISAAKPGVLDSFFNRLSGKKK